ncbi:urb2/Npa2 family protein [Wolffia australiana]
MSIERPAPKKALSKKRKRAPAPEAAPSSQEAGLWKGLDLLLSLRSRDIPNDRKIDLVFNFIGEDRRNGVVQTTRLISFLADWIQHLLISTDSCLDFRLWIILKFCLEKSAVGVSHNLLRSIAQGLTHAFSSLDDGDSSRFLLAFIDCVSLLLKLNGRNFNAAGVDLWTSCAVPAVHLLSRISSKDCNPFSSKEELLGLLILLLDHFVSFMRFHPSPKTIFKPFVDRLLQPLVELLALLEENAGSSVFSAVEDCLYNGLCHPSHIAGFSALRNLNVKSLNESYHRHFFLKFQEIVHKKNAVAMGGLGHVFQVFVNSMMSKSENGSSSGLFEVFYQFMEPLFLDCKKFNELDIAMVETEILGFCSSIRTANDLLGVAAGKRIYDRTQDSAEGDFFCFLKRLYDEIVVAIRKLYGFWSSKSNVLANGLHLMARELVVSVGHFLEIEYNVIGDDMTDIWFMMLSYLAISDDSSLKNEILRVGRQLLDLYSDLRQATKPIFSLCEAMRSFKFHGDGSENGFSTNFPSGCLPPDARKKAVMAIVCSESIRLAVSNAIKSIPEGQAGECLCQLKSDFSEALTWLKSILSGACEIDSGNFFVEAELFGLISEIYCTVLESLVVTGSNSVLVGKSIDDLLSTVRMPLESFLQKEWCDFDCFYSCLAGKSLADRVSLLQTSSIFLCLFRLYVSCRSLSWNKSFITCSGKDWEGEEGHMVESYFSWLVNPSISLVSIIKGFSIYSSKEQVAKFPPLTYVLNMMAMQRLVDLKLLLKSFNYLVQRNKKLVQTQAQNKKLRHLIKVLRQEASDLTGFLIEPLLLFDAAKDSKWDFRVCSLNKKSLPIATFWLLSQNIDVWPNHASRKGLKAFSSLLISHWLDQGKGGYSSTNHVTFHGIAAEVLKDVSFYEQTVVLRHLTLRLSSIFKKTVQSLMFDAFGETSSLSDIVFNPSKDDVMISVGVLSSLLLEMRTLEGLLNLSCILSEICDDQGILAAIVCYILYLERVLVSAIMSHDQLSNEVRFDLLKLFVSCRRTLKQLCFSSCKFINVSDQSTIQWLLPSVSRVVGLRASFFRDKLSSDVNSLFFRLLDHTSYLFSSLCGVINVSSVEIDTKLTSVAADLELKTKACNVKQGNNNEVSCILSCLQGFVWGLVSMPCVLDEIFPVEKSMDLFEEFLDRCVMMILPSDHDDQHHLKLSVLRSSLEGENLDIAFLIRQIFLSAAGILKFRQSRLLQKPQKRHHLCNYLRSTSANALIESADLLSFGESPSHLFVYMDGIIKYLEVLGSCLTADSSVLSGGLYSQMVNIHLRAMGKCISLQGKAATLASHETAAESEEHSIDVCSASLTSQKLDELRSRLRLSFKELLREQLRSKFVLLIQSLGSILVGMRRGGMCNDRVSAIIAAGLDFLDLVFDSFSGDKLFGIIKDHAQNLVGSLFNIILHLQGPFIFSGKAYAFDELGVDADPGSTVLMCVEILRKFSRRNAQLKMDPCFVGQSLRVPSSLFMHFHQIKSSQSPSQTRKSIGRFFLDLYAACCRLLCTVIRHQKSETTQCIALLEDSTTTLLVCLESHDEEGDGQFALNVEEASTCAGFLRRVYEEIGQQKDSVGTFASHFLSDYLSVCSGTGPRKTGITREVDEALRPGMYALVDICSPGDFQKLHTILGEGPCRRALANLRNDYKLYFQYQGKI